MDIHQRVDKTAQMRCNNKSALGKFWVKINVMVHFKDLVVSFI